MRLQTSVFGSTTNPDVSLTSVLSPTLKNARMTWCTFDYCVTIAISILMTSATTQQHHLHGIDTDISRRAALPSQQPGTAKLLLGWPQGSILISHGAWWNGVSFPILPNLEMVSVHVQVSVPELTLPSPMECKVIPGLTYQSLRVACANG